jgi:hypothetical protein
MSATIFISIASYLDPLLFFTVMDAMDKADLPANLRFALVDQNPVSQRDKVKSLSFANQIRWRLSKDALKLS